jgi:hypothetical protein
MKIAIVESSTGKVIYRTEVNLNAMNYQPQMREFNDLAWEAAVDDGAVEQADKAKYAFKVLED